MLFQEQLSNFSVKRFLESRARDRVEKRTRRRSLQHKQDRRALREAEEAYTAEGPGWWKYFSQDAERGL